MTLSIGTVWAAILLALGTCHLFATEAPAQGERITRLVQQLGSESFAQRERATRELTELGAMTREALEHARDDADAEVRIRARAILTTVLEADFRDRLEAFAADYDGSQQRSLPGWERFQGEFGAGRLARQLFVEVQRAEPELMEAYAKGGAAASEALDVRGRVFFQQMLQSREAMNSWGTIAALLLIGSADDVTIDDQLAAELYARMIYQHAGFRNNVFGGVWSPILKKLVGMWVVKDTGAIATVQKLMVAANYDLKPQALVVATRVLSRETDPVLLRQYSLLTVAKFGGKEHVPLVEKLLHDKTSCGPTQAANPPRQLDVQMRDVALAVLVHLTGQKANEFGAASVQPAPLPPLMMLVFASDEKREAAIAKWTRWRTEHPAL